MIPVSHSHKETMRDCSQEQQKGTHSQNMSDRIRGHSHQHGLLPESYRSTERLPKGEQARGRWRLNVQPQHSAHTPKNKHKKTITNNPKPQNKTPQPPLLVQGNGLTAANSRMRMGLCQTRGNLFPVTFSSCPSLSRNALEHKFHPQEKESDSEKISKRLQSKNKQTTTTNKTLVATGPGSKRGRNLHIEMYLKSKSKKLF